MALPPGVEQSRGPENSGPNLVRNLIYFPIKELVHYDDTLAEVTITLYRDYDYPYSEGGAYGDNACRLHILTEEWDENTVTWNTQPTYDAGAFVNIPASNSYDSVEVNVTALIKNCVENNQPYYGFMLKNTVEEIYKSINFFSSDGDVPSRRPKVKIAFRSPEGCAWRKHQNPLYFQDGHVAIGDIDAHGYTLAVHGTFFSQEAVVNPSGWPDYVFSDDYSLQSLEQVEDFIKEKGHLPNIPDSKTVEQNGIEIGDMNKRLLLKIEELTLYLLEQNSKIKALQSRIDQMGKP